MRRKRIECVDAAIRTLERLCTREHAGRVRAVVGFGQAEAADLLERVDAGEKPVVVSFGAKSQHRAPEQVELQSTNQAVIIRLVVMLGLARLGAI